MKIYVVEENNVLYAVKRTHAPSSYVAMGDKSLLGKPLESYEEIVVVDAGAGISATVTKVRVDAAALAILQDVADKTSQISAKYNEMNLAVLVGMVNVFETSNPDSASAYYETYKEMVADASVYSSLGLKVAIQIMNVDGTELFDEGAALDTDAKILSYAQRKIVLAKEYSAFRVQRIQQFKDEKLAIEVG